MSTVGIDTPVSFATHLLTWAVAAAAAAAAYLGGWDTSLQSLVTLMALDVASGLLRAFYNKEVSSDVSFRGITKKGFILLVVAAATVADDIASDKGLPDGIGRAAMIYGFMIYEIISILENASQVLNIPFLEAVLVKVKTAAGIPINVPLRVVVMNNCPVFTGNPVPDNCPAIIIIRNRQQEQQSPPPGSSPLASV